MGSLFFENLKISLSAVFANKTRSILTALGIVIGVLSVTLMGTLISGLDRSFESSMSWLGKDILYVSRYEWFSDMEWWEVRNRPNATCIVVEDSNRFGLSQLHQLRGRVGRSSHQGFCYLAYKTVLNEDADKRLDSLISHSNGFKIAEEDLLIRGSGDYFGSRQSGHLNNFKLATLQDFITNVDIIKNLQGDISNLSDSTRDKLLRRWHNDEEDNLKL